MEEKVTGDKTFRMESLESVLTCRLWSQSKPLSELKVPQQVEDVEIVDEEEVPSCLSSRSDICRSDVGCL